MEKVSTKEMNIIMAALYTAVSSKKHFEDKVVELRKILLLDTSEEFFQQAKEMLYILRIDAFNEQRRSELSNVLTGDLKPNRYFLGLINRADLFQDIDDRDEFQFELLSKEQYDKLESVLPRFDPNPLYEERQATKQTNRSFLKRMMNPI